MAQKGDPIGIPQQPGSLKINASGIPGVGQAILDWKRVRGAKSYLVQLTNGAASSPETVWQDAMVSTKSRCTISGLTSGQYYSFRVIAVGAAGNSLPSSSVTAVIG